MHVSSGTHFQRVIPDDGLPAQNPSEVKRVVFCTGKIYYELTRERKLRNMENSVAITRIEQVPSSSVDNQQSLLACVLSVKSLYL